MRRLFAGLLLSCLLGTATLWAEEQRSTDQLSPEDLKVVAVLELLQLMDMVEELDMVKDMPYLIEENPNESKN